MTETYEQRCKLFLDRANISNRTAFRRECRALLAEARMRGEAEDEWPIQSLLDTLEGTLSESDKVGWLFIPAFISALWVMGALFMLVPLWTGSFSDASMQWWTVPWTGTVVCAAFATWFGFVSAGLVAWDLWDNWRRKPK